MVRRLAIGLLAAGLGAGAAAQEQAPNRRSFTIEARGGAFSPSRIEVSQDDLVRITLTGHDQPVSFAIDAYRIVKRAAGGQTIAFEFRADQPGTFTFYCNLSDERCKEMKGTMEVRSRR